MGMPGSNLSKIAIILLIIFAILIAVGLLKFGSIFVIFLIYPWVSSGFSELGLNPYLLKMIAIPTTIAFWLAIVYLILSSKKRLRILGVVFVGMLMMFHSLVMFMATREHTAIDQASSLNPANWGVGGFLISSLILLTAGVIVWLLFNAVEDRRTKFFVTCPVIVLMGVFLCTIIVAGAQTPSNWLIFYLTMVVLIFTTAVTALTYHSWFADDF